MVEDSRPPLVGPSDPRQQPPAPQGPKALPKYEIWWRLLQLRLQQASLGIPPKLKGTLQFKIDRSGESPCFRHLIVRGRDVAGFDGLAAWSDVWIETSDRELASLLDDHEVPAGSLRAAGNTQLAETLFKSLAGMKKPMSQLALRSQG